MMGIDATEFPRPIEFPQATSDESNGHTILAAYNNPSFYGFLLDSDSSAVLHFPILSSVVPEGAT